jgi:AcrR family transcriptional regulator
MNVISGVVVVPDPNSREKIKQKAVEIFSSKGYHGTSMRDIAGAAGCSLPTLYYHYKSKNDLYEAIVVAEFLQIVARLNLQLKLELLPEKSYALAIKQMKELKPYDKAVFKMAMKVMHGFECAGSTRDKIMEWERNRVAHNRKILDQYIGNENIKEDFAELLIRVTENMVEKIVLLDEDIPDQAIESQLSLLFRLAK